jgi:YrbI family 3-deoxy-D-manno-octulosonate 8-phosphate phosphatase
MKTLSISIKNIQLIIYDFDGVMTNNKVYIDQNGNEFVQVNRADGLAVSEIKNLGIKQIIISTETNTVVHARAKKLGIQCIQCVADKEKELLSYCESNNIDLKNVIYIGNDMNDKKAMELVGWSWCPSDAHESIKDISKFVFTKKGGEGVVRELLDLITKE